MTASPLHRRALAALLYLPLVLPAQATAVWPEPQATAPAAPSRPQFRAPSAASCDRPVSERIVPAPG